MQQRSVGSLKVSVVGIGCGNVGRELDLERTREIVGAALDAGMNYFDTADVYGRQADGKTYSEVYLGRAVKDRRSECVIGTKFGSRLAPGSDGARPEYVKSACEASLRRLGTDYIDIYQLHHPDPRTPIEDTLGALAELVQEGKVLQIGASRFEARHLREAAAAAASGGPRFVSVQSEYSLMLRGDKRELIPECERQGVAFLPFFPLFHGLLTGKYQRGQVPRAGTRLAGDPRPGRPLDILSDRNFDIVDALAAFAAERGHTLLELAFAWLLARPSVSSVLAGATSAAQVAANAAAAAWSLTPDEVAAVGDLAPVTDSPGQL
jgi:aryl-alcohol dehydrogenase-like predicted oxidoreductase